MDGTLPHAVGMDAISVVKANLRALMRHAAATARPEDEVKLSTQKALAEATGLGRPTIARMYDGTGGVGIDTLERVAKAFDLQAWHLLVPGLDPANTPVVGASEAEKELYRTYEQLKVRFGSRTVSVEETDPRAVDVHRNRKSTKGRPKVGAAKHK